MDLREPFISAEVPVKISTEFIYFKRLSSEMKLPINSITVRPCMAVLSHPRSLQAVPFQIILDYKKILMEILA